MIFMTHLHKHIIIYDNFINIHLTLSLFYNHKNKTTFLLVPLFLYLSMATRNTVFGQTNK